MFLSGFAVLFFPTGACPGLICWVSGQNMILLGLIALVWPYRLDEKASKTIRLHCCRSLCCSSLSWHLQEAEEEGGGMVGCLWARYFEMKAVFLYFDECLFYFFPTKPNIQTELSSKVGKKKNCQKLKPFEPWSWRICCGVRENGSSYIYNRTANRAPAHQGESQWTGS